MELENGTGVNTLLIPLASHWAAGPISCHFKAWADGVQLGTKDDTAAVFTVPPGTAELKLTVTPVAAVYWETTVFLTISSAGVVTVKAGSTPFVKLTTIADAIVPDHQDVFVTVLLSRFKDVTSDVLDLLNHPPATRHISQDGKTWNDVVVNEAKDHQDRYGAWPPPDWGLHAVPDAHFLDVTTPVKSGVLNFAPDPSLSIDVDSVVLRLAGVDAPQLFAVTWPKAIAPKAGASATPFLVFIRQENVGNFYNLDGLFVGGELDSQPYPNNFDYADTLFEQLHYANTPFFTPGLKGVPYQVAKAGANVVTVIPMNPFRSGGKEFGVMEDTEQTGKILEELQAFMFLRAGIADPPKSVGKTALASFSSGNFYLGRWLADPKNRSGNFLSKIVTAVYFLDPILNPPRTDVNTFIASALTWAGKADKRIRLYMRYPSASHSKLLPGKSLPSSPYILNSSDNRRTAAVLSDADWAKAFTKATGRSAGKWNWQWSHHLFAATMLTHALAQGDLS
jgi:hypothetical protein